MTEPGFGRLEQGPRHAPKARELAHQQKKRDNGQRMVGKGRIGFQFQLAQHRFPRAGDQIGADDAAQQHR
jgi:hypothetical protein